MSLDLAVKMVKATAGFHATGYHFLKTIEGGADKYFERNKSIVHHGWLKAKDDETKKQNDAWMIQDYGNLTTL